MTLDFIEHVKDNKLYGIEEHRIRKLSSSGFLTLSKAISSAKDPYHAKLAFLNLVSNGDINFGFQKVTTVHDRNSPIFSICGGGISGIVSALQLRNLHHAYGLPDPYIVICEADSSLGGRIKGGKIPFRASIANNTKGEYGAHFIYDKDDIKLQQLASQLKWDIVEVPNVLETTVYDTDGSIINPTTILSVLNRVLKLINGISKTNNYSQVLPILENLCLPIFKSPIEIQLVNLIVADLEYRYGSFDKIFPVHLPHLSIESFRKYQISKNASSLILQMDNLVSSTLRADIPSNITSTTQSPESPNSSNSSRSLTTIDFSQFFQFKDGRQGLSNLLLKDHQCGIYALCNMEIQSIQANDLKVGNDSINVTMTANNVTIYSSGSIICTPPSKWRSLFSEPPIKRPVKEVAKRLYTTCLETSSIVCHSFESNGYFFVLGQFDANSFFNPNRGLHYFFKHIKEDCSVVTSFSVGLGSESFLDMDNNKKYASALKTLSFFKLKRVEDMIASTFGNNRYISGGIFASDPQCIDSINAGFENKPIFFASDVLGDGTLQGAIKNANTAAFKLFRHYYSNLFDFE